MTANKSQKPVRGELLTMAQAAKKSGSKYILSDTMT
jgi:hypothetical protein